MLPSWENFIFFPWHEKHVQENSVLKSGKSTGWVRQNVGHLADCEIALNYQIVMKYIFPSSQESNLDHKPFSIQIGHLMEFCKTIFFARPYMGVLQTCGIFCQAPSIFHVGERYRYMLYYQGRMKSLVDGIFSPGMSPHNLPCMEKMFERHQ